MELVLQVMRVLRTHGLAAGLASSPGQERERKEVVLSELMSWSQPEESWTTVSLPSGSYSHRSKAAAGGTAQSREWGNGKHGLLSSIYSWFLPISQNQLVTTSLGQNPWNTKQTRGRLSSGSEDQLFLPTFI